MNKGDAWNPASEPHLVRKPNRKIALLRFFRRFVNQWRLLALCVPALTLVVIFKATPHKRNGPRYGIMSS